MKAKLYPNQKISVQRLESNDDQFYSSYIISVEEDTISIATPLDQRGLVMFSPGDQIRAYAWPFMFETEVLKRQFRPHPVLTLKRPQTLIKDQKRSFVRLERTLPIVIREQGTLPEDATEAEIRTHTIDISGGGVLVVYPHPLPGGTGVELDLYLPEKVSCSGRVRLEYVEEIKPKVRLAIEFVDIAPAEQDKIIAFIFKCHRELRRRGLL